MHALKRLRGLPDIDDTRLDKTVGAVLAAGVKGPTGAPTETDRFHFLLPKPTRREFQTGAGKKYTGDARQYHPAFAAFNNAKKEHRTLVRAQLAFPSEEQFWDPGFYAHRGPPGDQRVRNPTNKAPWCRGNGKDAQRWNGAGYDDIACPGNGCPFRQLFTRGNNSYRPCHRGHRIYFYPVWKEDSPLPSVLTKLKSYDEGGGSVSSFASMLESVRNLCRTHGITGWTWYRMPFAIHLGQASSEKGVYTDISFSLDGDVFEWLQWQGSRVLALQAASQRLLGASSEEELQPEVVDEDHLTITPDLVKPAREATGGQASTREPMPVLRVDQRAVKEICDEEDQ